MSALQSEILAGRWAAVLDTMDHSNSPSPSVLLAFLFQVLFPLFSTCSPIDSSFPLEPFESLLYLQLSSSGRSFRTGRCPELGPEPVDGVFEMPKFDSTDQFGRALCSSSILSATRNHHAKEKSTPLPSSALAEVTRSQRDEMMKEVYSFTDKETRDQVLSLSPSERLDPRAGIATRLKRQCFSQTVSHLDAQDCIESAVNNTPTHSPTRGPAG
ncbi:hypothetical protein K458DRAFT_396393 [Lentithecium fluviatile CBS 122367]|uniref:Uncharacterized protein n=1 Tax=Lentithecium fluviatile CBS 122367 TaxID=1168545 RepID=A0A6G1IGD3_9PLEO|nr:hypothetical protein K458DRAFT_396393 [Lentithecium fluviatile CBS 122367]